MRRRFPLRWLWRALLGAGMALALCLVPWPAAWPSGISAGLAAALQVVLGLWGGPAAAVGLALGYVGHGLLTSAGSTPMQLVPLLAPAARALTAWVLTPLAVMDPRLSTPADWRRWLLGGVLAANLVGTAVALSPTLAEGNTLSTFLRPTLIHLASTVAGTWLLGTLLLRCLWRLFRQGIVPPRPEPVDLPALLDVLPSRGKGPSV